jgi:DNA polymerase type B, organellar and viral
LIKGYEFSKIILFNDYVNHCYNKKKINYGATRFIAKMHLNQLYGIFGRKQDTIETINIFNKDLPLYLTTRIIKTIIPINNKMSTILIQSNINSNIVNELNISLTTNIFNNNINIKSNVALAGAVTAYARIYMMDFILDEGVAYTDTDSNFTTNKINKKFIGNDLGLMKNELKGNIIDEAYFLGIKQYGYTYRKLVKGEIYNYILLKRYINLKINILFFLILIIIINSFIYFIYDLILIN